jgi:hypothetical protein
MEQFQIVSNLELIQGFYEINIDFLAVEDSIFSFKQNHDIELVFDSGVSEEQQDGYTTQLADRVKK